MFRPWLRVAKPDDWTGKLAQLAVSLLTLVLLLMMLLAKMPPRWVELAWGSHFLARAPLVMGLLYLIGWFRAIAFGLLRRSAVLAGNRLRFRSRGRRTVVDVRKIAEMRIELRPPPSGEVFVVEMRNGEVWDMCPVSWEGSERIYAKVTAKLRARARREASA